MSLKRPSVPHTRTRMSLSAALVLVLMSLASCGEEGHEKCALAYVPSSMSQPVPPRPAVKGLVPRSVPRGHTGTRKDAGTRNTSPRTYKPAPRKDGGTFSVPRGQCPRTCPESVPNACRTNHS